GNLWVADFYNQRVEAFAPDGSFQLQLGETGEKGIGAGRFNYPTDVAVLENGEIAVADAYNDRIQVFDSQGRFLRKWGGPWAANLAGGGNGWFRTATGVAGGPESQVFAADFENHRIQAFTSGGSFLAAVGEKGSAPGQLLRPTDLAVDENGVLYVVDFGNDRIQVFAPPPSD
ncbi:MAG: 6-bladed beta-propeller, partial [Planctomycetota bacterium]